MDDQLDAFRRAYGHEWANCETPDCQWKQCTWSELPMCCSCATKRLGTAEMIRRYNATHDEPWPFSDMPHRAASQEDR